MATPEVVGRATYEAAELSPFWMARFPDELPEKPVLPNALIEPEIELEGHLLRAVSVAGSFDIGLPKVKVL